MKLSKKAQHFQRNQVDEELRSLTGLKNSPRPRRGWLKAVREALGMTTRQLADLLETDNAGVVRLEEREVKGTVTFEAVERAARAMGCHFVYAIVPDESLERTLDQRAHETAKRLLTSVGHTMRLEQQGVSDSVTAKQIEALAQDLKARLDPVLWKK
jgi:predicted DNA-binding mobile mystery protein A